jgi:virulence factor Mce-like protein
MIKKAPSKRAIAILVSFAASCIGLVLYLWISFGGPLPLNPIGYRLSVEFDQAVQLATEADVRIAGISVGKVITVGLDHKTGLTRAMIQIEHRYAPRPADTRAVLRTKSILGETFVELSPGSRNGRRLPDGARLPQAQVAPTVALDQILSTFDPATRRAFSTWMQQSGVALTGRGESVSEALAALYPFATNVDSVLSVLNRERAATRAFVSDGGQVFAALASSPPALQRLVSSSNTVFGATAAESSALAAAIKALPPFLTATRQTIGRLTSFGDRTRPLVDQLLPAARDLSPALVAIGRLAPQLRAVFTDAGRLVRAANPGLPAFERFLDRSVPLLARLKPYLGGIVPVLDYAGSYQRELAAFLANTTAATNATEPVGSGALKHYIRAALPVNPETLAGYRSRPSSSRSNAYMDPGGYGNLTSGLQVFGSYLCTATAQPAAGATITATLQAVLQQFYYTATPAGPPCAGQTPLASVTTGQLQQFPHLTAIP